jgi:MFS family permease
MTQLIVFRAIQGVGAGALMPIGMTIIGDLFPPECSGKMQGLFRRRIRFMSVIGPAVGGFIVELVRGRLPKFGV